jgi:uncharacterized LabA/DUF88 family protein
MQADNQRLAFLVDEVNATCEARDLHPAFKLDYESILARLQDYYTIIRTILYCVQFAGQTPVSFRERMRYLGIDVKFKTVRFFADGRGKANWDIEIALDAIEMQSCVDAICICSHDTDFIPLMNHLRRHGVKVMLMAFAETVAARLVAAADEFIPIRRDMLMQSTKGSIGPGQLT